MSPRDAHRTGSADDRTTCRTCAHYGVSWDAERPHACRAFGFKSQALPSRVVEDSSGDRCGLFESRAAAPRL